MGADAVDGDGGAVGGERLVLDAARALAVHRVAEIGAQLLDVDIVDAAADLFIRREQDLDGAVLHVGIVDEEIRGIHDLGDAGLVVGAEQRGAVRGDDVVADLVLQRGMFVEADHLAGVAGQGDVAAAIVLHHLRLDVLAGHVGRGVHMRAEADHRHLLVGVARDRGVDVAEFVEMGIGDAHGLEFGDEHAAEVFLLFGRRRGRRGRIGLGVDGDIAKEALGHGMREGEGGHC